MSAPQPDPAAAIDYGRSLLLTDLYQLNMVEAYLAEGMEAPAVFELFVRKLPETRGFLLTAGLEQAIRFLLEARVDGGELDWLHGSGRFSQQLIAFLRDFRFSGDVEALPEGTLCFADQPLIRVTAPMPEAQLVETRLINFLQYQTLVATKAARMKLAAPEAALVDFGLRRAHSGEAGLLAARAAYLAGFAGTASVPAARHFGVPLFGTMAHSFVQAHENERAAFLSFARARPDQTTFLIDTFDTEAAAEKVCALAPKLAAAGIPVRGVRIDSGDLGAHALTVRAILDAAGLHEVRIVASGGLDEYALAELIDRKAPIAAYGIGTSLVTSDDQPALDCAYKLKAYDGIARRKRSEKKAYWPGPVQVYRRFAEDGTLAEDLLTTADEAPGADWRPQVVPFVRAGRLLAPLPSLESLRERTAAQLAHLPADLRRPDAPPSYEVAVSDRLKALAEEVDRRTGQ